MENAKEELTCKPKPLGSFSQDGRQYGRTAKGTVLRINPMTGKVVPRVRLSKKDRLKMRAEMKKAAAEKRK
jgi:hypothetical protein